MLFMFPLSVLALASPSHLPVFFKFFFFLLNLFFKELLHFTFCCFYLSKFGDAYDMCEYVCICTCKCGACVSKHVQISV